MGGRLRERARSAHVPGAWRALALAACNLWSNMLLFATPLLASPEASIPTRATSVLTSLVGFVAAFAVARRLRARTAMATSRATGVLRDGAGTPSGSRGAGMRDGLRDADGEGLAAAFGPGDARVGGLLGERRALMCVAAVVAVLATGVHVLGVPAIPAAVDVAAVALYSVFFAFLLVGAGETYARMEPFQALVLASVSFFIGWVGGSAAALLPRVPSAIVACVMPLVALVLMPCWGRARRGDVAAGRVGAGAGLGREADLATELAAAPAGTGELGGAGGAQAGGEAGAARTHLVRSLRDDLRRTLVAIPVRILVGLAVTHLALGAVLAATSEATAVTSYFAPSSIAMAAVTCLVCLGVALLLRDRVPLVTFYKVALVVLVLGVFLLGEAGIAQLMGVVSFVGVYIVSWALVAQRAHAGLALGVLPAFVIAAGRLVEQAGEGVGLALVASGMLSGMTLVAVVAVLLLVAAAFLFTGSLEGDAVPASPDSASREDAPAATGEAPRAAAPSAEERLAWVAQAYRLSARETEVFELWATGHDLKYVQERLGLSLSTVKTHVRHIYAKTGTHSRAEVVILFDEARPGPEK